MVVVVFVKEKFVLFGFGINYLLLVIKLILEINIYYKICYLFCIVFLILVKVYLYMW